MQDLSVIIRQNAEAAAQHGATAARREGKFISAHFNGLHFLDYTAHDTAEAARSHGLAQTTAAGEYYEVLNPLPPIASSVSRDQTEDRGPVPVLEYRYVNGKLEGTPVAN